MASDYTIAANGILVELKAIVAEFAEKYPDIGSWEERAAALLPAFAGRIGKAAVDALNAAHGTNVVPITGVMPVADTAAAPTNILQTVLGYLQVGCGVIAESGPIEALINALPYGTVATGIADMVCEAVMAQPKKLTAGGGPQTVTVKGIRIPVHASPFVK